MVPDLRFDYGEEGVSLVLGDKNATIEFGGLLFKWGFASLNSDVVRGGLRVCVCHIVRNHFIKHCRMSLEEEAVKSPDRAAKSFFESKNEFEDAFQGIQDRPRIPGSVPFQSYRRTDYSSSPPTRGDSSSYSRGIYGKWDNRSSGRSERDTDSQSDWDSGLLDIYSSLLQIIYLVDEFVKPEISVSIVYDIQLFILFYLEF
ncbi:hypothetical protein Acr_08g0008950 [Actinidia rufa]|uniref:Uncharacterized protein n=1 Tax=Actinidia rufa TaxID=165716 RepID=A0A7J0F2R5_9ERIC|nr:hypothetical protein Acr_08g0008950 [Actinidia rufa]